MAATGEQQPPQAQQTEATSKITEKMSALSFSIWPPTQRMRDAVANRLVETLSTPSSVISKRFSALPADEAADAVRRIEAEAFAAVSVSADSTEDINGGIELLQVYSKEISRRMLDAVKSRSGNGTVVPVPEGNGAQSPDVALASDEEIKAVETEV